MKTGEEMSEELNIVQQTPYPEEILSDDGWTDDGTIVENVATLREAVVGRKIVSAERKGEGYFLGYGTPFVLTLDDGSQVELYDSSDCCAYTELGEFLLHPELVDHVILGVGTTDWYTTWHIYADLGDVVEMEVGWSCGNPFYYGYGFDIRVVPVEDQE